MKYAALVVATVAGLSALTAGCASTASQEDLEKVRLDLEKLRAQMQQKNDLQVQLHQDLLTAHSGLLERIAKLERQSMSLQETNARLEDQVKSLHAAAAPKESPGPGAPPAAAIPGVPQKPLEDILVETQAALAALRAGKMRADEAAQQLRPYAKDAAPFVLDEIRKSLVKVDYTIQLESVLSRFPAAEIKVPLQNALKEKSVRLHVARVVGNLGDRELSKILEPFATSEDEDFRLMAGESLVRCKNPMGLPALLLCLKSEQRDTRTIAINALKPLNRGEDFGYRAHLAPEPNTAALRLWEEWAGKNGKSIFE
jgi:hypothetical protein